MTLPGHPMAPSTSIPSSPSIPAWLLPRPARDQELCFAATRGHGVPTHGEATPEDAPCPEKDAPRPSALQGLPTGLQCVVLLCLAPAGAAPCCPCPATRPASFMSPDE